MTVRILTGRVQLVMMVRVLDRADLQAAPRKLLHQLDDESRLAMIFRAPL